MQELMLETPVDVLNYALTLEHLEHAFYRDGLEEFTADDFTAAGYSANVYDYFGMIRDHEQEHVDTITQVISDLGGEARHAAYLNGLTGESPFPDAVNPTLTPDEVLAAAGPFIVS
jgi:rubrerythrin